MDNYTEQHPTLVACIEALSNASERLRTLTGLSLSTIHDRLPAILTTSSYYRIPARIDGSPYNIYIPREVDMFQRAGLYMACDVTRISRAGILARATYLPQELLIVLDNNTLRTDIIIESAGLTLRSYLNHHAMQNDQTPIRTLLQGIAALAEKLHTSSLVHGQIIPERIHINDSHQLTMTLAGYPVVQQRSAAADNQMLLTIATALYIIGSSPIAYQQSGVELFVPRVLTSILPFIEGWQSPMARRMTELLHTIRKGNPKNKHTEQLLREIAQTPFDDTMESTLAQYYQHSNGNQITIIRPKSSTANTESLGVVSQNDGLIDFSTCQVVCAMCEMLIRYMRDGAWGYADREGRRLPLPPLMEAGEFYEGRAAVRTAEGWGLINSEGHFVMEARYDALHWHREHNVVTACLNGKWHLYDRTAQQLTSFPYDFIGKCCEGYMAVGRSGRYSFIDTNGHQLTDLRYDEVFDFKGGRAQVFCNGCSHHIDTNGKRID